ncbi:MAG TPA: dihydropyrimidinase, partial [Anaerolineae bacterium]|nr:dihydropyrimidinase [Anaerolineae bacterium]
MYDLVIRGGQLVTSDGVISAEIALKNAKIAAIGHNLTAKRTLEASGKLILPGGVDIHPHMQLPLPAATSSDTFFTGTRAAALGGTTSIVDFVHPEPQHNSLAAALADRRAEADPQLVIDYALHMAIGPNDITKLAELPAIVAAGCGTFKLYMAYGLRLSDDQLYQALSAIKSVHGMTVIHAENWEMIGVLQAEALARGNTEPRWHPRTRPAEFEAQAAATAITIAAFVDTPLHIFHVSTGQVVEQIRAARARGLAVTGETCPQYLLLNWDVFEVAGVQGALPVCSPPIRAQHEQDALWQAVAAGDLQLISTDHCPFMLVDKAVGYAKDFTQIAGGVPSVEMRLAAIYSRGVRSGLLSLAQWVDLCCTRPAKLVGLATKGALEIGRDADIVIFDPEKEVLLS